MNDIMQMNHNFAAEFETYLAQVDTDYKKQLTKLPLFQWHITANWTNWQKKYFAAVFYHLRGHFIDFMWYIANFSDERIKKLVLANIHEELGVGTKFSHEKLYERFANECGVDMQDEIINETHYLPFARQFNKSHLQWLATHKDDQRLAAFAAYERLDNIDYAFLSNFADSLNLSKPAKTFFQLHVRVEHFEPTIKYLLPIWQNSSTEVREAFEFIYSHQYKMWEELSRLC